ncbi:MAG: lipid A biosynthesis acyltransferase [Burkholderiales bacterium]|nr:lipid A biosynthesis acyltransferase [Burkholderiales bacterium]
MARIALGIIWLLRLLPLPLLAGLGAGLGTLLYLGGRERRRIALVNLALCFPELDARARRALARRHFRALARSLLERGILWWSSPERMRRVIRVEGEEHWRELGKRPVILLAPHFVGFEMGGIRLHMDRPMASMYSRQSNPALDAVFLHGRSRFNESRLFSRQDGVRPVVRTLRAGWPFFYLPDMDLGARDAVFVPFFGVMAATVTALARLAAISGAAVIPCITRQLPGGQGYVTRLYPSWQDFPGADQHENARRMNAFIEERVREMPEQYYWVHKRFKTRPPGEPSLYER